MPFIKRPNKVGSKIQGGIHHEQQHISQHPKHRDGEFLRDDAYGHRLPLLLGMMPGGLLLTPNFEDGTMSTNIFHTTLNGVMMTFYALLPAAVAYLYFMN